MESTSKTPFFQRKSVRSLGATVLGSIIYAFTMVWILDLGDFFAGGVTGISQLIIRFSETYFGRTFSLGILFAIFNIPLLIVGWHYISKKFAYLTIISIITQMVTIFLLEQIGYQPLSILFTNHIEDVVYNPQTGEIVDIVITKGLAPGSRLLLAMLGGALSGVGGALCLSSGGSLGGMDIVSNSLFVRRNASFTKLSLIIDFIIILLAGIYNYEAMLYTFVRLIINIVTIGHFYTIYKIARLEIVTDKAMEIREILLSKYHHGLTIYPAQGGFSLRERTSIVVYVSSYEVKDYLQSIHSCDPKAFVSVSSVVNIIGNYVKKTIN